MALRREIFAQIKHADLPCFWYAIHVAGLHANHQMGAELLKKQRESLLSARNGIAPRIKGRGPRENPASLHVELFSGLYTHFVAFLMERRKHGVDVEVQTDQVDTPLMKEFRTVAERLLSDDPKVTDVTGFDTVEEKLVTGSITIMALWPPELSISPVVNSLSINTKPDSDGLVLAADVLANSLNYHFNNRDSDTLYAPLNCKAAIDGHPLAEHLDAFSNWGQGDLIGDKLYRHPSAR